MLDLNINNIQFAFQPQVIAQLTSLDESEGVNFKTLEDIIKSDQNLSFMVLKMANSPFYNRGNPIKNLKMAISILGFKLVKTFAVTFSTKFFFEGNSYARFNRYVWKHSVIVGILSRFLAEKYDKENVDTCFIGGLLHDLGKVILSSVDRKSFIDVINKAVGDGVFFHTAEFSIYQTSHNLIGSLAMEKWNMPPEFSAICRFHELDQDFDSIESSNKKSIHIVALANYIAHKLDYGHFISIEDRLVSKTLEAIGVLPHTINELIQSSEQFLKTDEYTQNFLKMV